MYRSPRIFTRNFGFWREFKNTLAKNVESEAELKESVTRVRSDSQALTGLARFVEPLTNRYAELQKQRAVRRKEAAAAAAAREGVRSGARRSVLAWWQQEGPRARLASELSRAVLEAEATAIKRDVALSAEVRHLEAEMAELLAEAAALDVEIRADFSYSPKVRYGWRATDRSLIHLDEYEAGAKVDASVTKAVEARPFAIVDAESGSLLFAESLLKLTHVGAEGVLTKVEADAAAAAAAAAAKEAEAAAELERQGTVDQAAAAAAADEAAAAAAAAAAARPGDILGAGEAGLVPLGGVKDHDAPSGAGEAGSALVVAPQSFFHRQWSNLTDAARKTAVFQSFMGLKHRVEESDNVVVQKSLEVGEEARDFASSLRSRILPESETASALRKVREVDPYFDEADFAEYIRTSFAPTFLTAIIEGDVQTIAGLSGESQYRQLLTAVKQRKASGLVLDSHILDVRQVEFREAKAEGSDVTIVFTFVAQQTHCVRRVSTGEVTEGDVDDVQAVHYYAVFKAGGTGEVPWRCAQLQMIGSFAQW